MNWLPNRETDSTVATPSCKCRWTEMRMLCSAALISYWKQKVWR